MRKIFMLLCCVPLLCACEKEIQLDYRDIDPLYVVNGGVSNEGCRVIITKTRDIDNPTPGDGIEVQSVTISDAAGAVYLLSYGPDGTYTTDQLIGTSGTAYTLTVLIGDLAIEATSTMPEAVQIDEIGMHWEDMMGNDMLHLDVLAHYNPEDVNYFYYRILRNGKLFKWNVVKEVDNSSGDLELDISLMSRNKAEKNDPDDYDSIILEGETVTVEVRAIDMKTYDYLFSAKLSSQNSSNPLSNFNTPYVPGYFSAYYVATQSFEFYYRDVND